MKIIPKPIFKFTIIILLLPICLGSCKPLATCIHMPKGSITLNVNEEQEIEVFAAEYYSCDYLKVDSGQVYNFIVKDKSTWIDLWTTSDARGFHNFLLREKKKRVEDADCFTLCGTTGICDKLSFIISDSLLNHEVKQGGDLHFFANDHKNPFFYKNNKGSIKIKVNRVR